MHESLWHNLRWYPQHSEIWRVIFKLSGWLMRNKWRQCRWKRLINVHIRMNYLWKMKNEKNKINFRVHQLKNEPNFLKINTKQLHQFLKIIFLILLNLYTGHILLGQFQEGSTNYSEGLEVCLYWILQTGGLDVFCYSEFAPYNNMITAGFELWYKDFIYFWEGEVYCGKRKEQEYFQEIHKCLEEK